MRPSLRPVTLESLSPGTSYQVQVRAVSDVGSGPLSDVRTISTFRGKLYVRLDLIMTNHEYSNLTGYSEQSFWNRFMNVICVYYLETVYH